MAEVLEFRGVEKAYGRLKALTGIDLAVAGGEVVVLIGPAGSGKTALLHLALGLDVPDRGEIRLAGRPTRRLPAAARRTVGAVFEDAALEPDQSVRANFRYVADLYGLRRVAATERMRTLLSRFALAGHESDRVRSLGKLEHRRLEIALAVLHRPRLLLVNDVGDGLGPNRAAQLIDDVCGLAAEEGTAVLWATSRPAEGKRADRIVVLRRGGIGFAGPPAELLARESATDLADAVAKLLGEKQAG